MKSSDCAAQTKMYEMVVRIFPFAVIQYGLMKVGLLEVSKRVKVLHVGLEVFRHLAGTYQPLSSYLFFFLVVVFGFFLRL